MRLCDLEGKAHYKREIAQELGTSLPVGSTFWPVPSNVPPRKGNISGRHKGGTAVSKSSWNSQSAHVPRPSDTNVDHSLCLRFDPICPRFEKRLAEVLRGSIGRNYDADSIVLTPFRFVNLGAPQPGFGWNLKMT